MAGILSNGLAFINAARLMRFHLTAPMHVTETQRSDRISTVGSIRFVYLRQFAFVRNRPWHPHLFKAPFSTKTAPFEVLPSQDSETIALSIATSQKDRVGTATKAMRSEKLIKKATVLPFEGKSIEAFVELEHEFLAVLVGQDKHDPHHTKRMVGIHRKFIENERGNLIASSQEQMKAIGPMRKNKEGRPHANSRSRDNAGNYGMLSFGRWL